ncbi:MAG: oligosaccharide flippase family protein [Candidatus Hydrogenedens sp.]|nr:oligosaccharide flippase family protein [Candidatus Hydrogenedens sp.]
MRPLRLLDLLPAFAFLASANIVQVAAAFLANLVLARLLIPEQFGRFALVLAGAQLVLSILSLRINVLIIRTPDAEDTPERRSLYFSVMTLETGAATLLALGYFLAIERVGAIEALLVVSIGLSHWLNHNKAFFERRMVYKGLAMIEAGCAIGAHGAAVALAIAGFGERSLFLREILTVVLQGGGLLLIGGLTFLPLRLPSRRDVALILGQSGGVWLDSMLEALFQRLGILIAGGLLGERGAGLLFLAQRLAMVPHQLLTPMVTRLAPNWFGRLEVETSRAAGRRTLLKVIAVPLVVAAVMTILLAGPMIHLVLGERWLPAAPAFAAMAGMVACLSLFEVMRGYCLSAARTRVLLAARCAQFAGYALPLVPILFGGSVDLQALGLALSAAYLCAFATGEFMLRR